jgi:hypothetical protein
VRSTLWGLLFLLLALPSGASSVTVREAVVVLTVQDGPVLEEPAEHQSPGVLLDMQITYAGPPSERLSGDFVFPDARITGLEATSSDAASLNYSASQQREGGRLVWSAFLPASGVAKVRLRAELLHAVLGTHRTNFIALEWLGGWPYPVRELRLHLRFPPGFHPEKILGKDDFFVLDRRVEAGARLVLSRRFRQMGAGEAVTGRITFSPGLTEDFGPLRFRPLEIAIYLAVVFLVFVPVFFGISRLVIFGLRSRRQRTDRGSSTSSMESMLALYRSLEQQKGKKEKADSARKDAETDASANSDSADED